MFGASARRDRRSSRKSLVSRRRLQLFLAGLWIVDGALQLQPFMFTGGFAHQIIAPAGMGQPGFVASGVAWSASLIASHPVMLDLFFAASQLILGLGLLWRRTVRVALAGSIAWSLGVWYMGEGLGEIAGGHASLITGAPGAVVLYALIAVISWPRPAVGRGLRWMCDAGSDDPPPPWTPYAWAALWVGGATLQALPGQNTSSALWSTISASADGAPGWLHAADKATAAGLHHVGPPVVAAVIAVELLIGVLPLLGRYRHEWRHWQMGAAFAGVLLSMIFWTIGQDFGQLYSGHATDPNAAPLFILLALAVLPAQAVLPLARGAASRNSGLTGLAGARQRDRPVSRVSPPPRSPSA